MRPAPVLCIIGVGKVSFDPGLEASGNERLASYTSLYRPHFARRKNERVADSRTDGRSPTPFSLPDSMFLHMVNGVSRLYVHHTKPSPLGWRGLLCRFVER